QEDHGRTTQVVVTHQLAHHLHTVELRHHDVENNDIGLPGAHGLETLDAVACGQDVEAFGLEAQLQHSPHDGVVVDDEDARLGHVRTVPAFSAGECRHQPPQPRSVVPVR